MEIRVDFGRDTSNLFLRALWSQIREQLGEGGWNFQPFKDGRKSTVHFGWVSAKSLKEPLEVSIRYKEKGSIKWVIVESKELEENLFLQDKIEFCVANAIKYSQIMKKKAYQVLINGLESTIGSYRGENFQITPCVNDNFLLSINLVGFDDLDMKTQFQSTANKILDFLAVETQSVFSYASLTDIEGQIINSEEIHATDVTWFGTGRPSIDKRFAISLKAKQFIDSMLLDTSDNMNKYLKACRLFHSAQKYMLMRYHRDDLEVSERLGRLLLPNEEIASVLYMSALEVASEINAEKPQQCNCCGNTVYSISSRVTDYVKQFEADDSYIKSFYVDRSKYLHVGNFFSDQSYAGTSVPQLDTNSPTGCKSQMPQKNLLSLGDVVSFCLRQHLQSGLM